MEIAQGTQPRDLIALAWYSIGFRPRHDLVLVGLYDGLAGPGPILRIPLPPRRHEPDLVDHLLAGLRRAGPALDGVVALVMHDELDSGRHRRLSALLRARAPGHRFDLADVIAVAPRGYRSLLCGSGCCPPEGRPLSEVIDSTVSVAMIASGEVLARDEAELIADVRPERPDPPGPPSAAQLVPAGRDHGPGERAAALAAWRALLEGNPAPLPALARAMADPVLSAAVMLCAVPGSADGPERLLGGEPLDPRAVFGTRPDFPLTKQVADALALVARQSPPSVRAHPVALLAQLCWWSGNGTRARLLAAHALELQPGHRVAELIQGLTAVPAPPPWQAGPGGSPPGGPRQDGQERGGGEQVAS
jgi:hypothetical protein